ncbi:MAG: hypothetical protein GY714_29030 [Desulfobacterales bacterium]|nr:hypothetical protein [Desulfobacterales bacterium]MCP4163202.1 hypothetical protein [Deltaproteobacteria bacterium]
MKVGDTIKFSFGKKKEMKDGKIIKILPKNVFLEVDFPNHKGKIIRRKAHELK